jgi:hypothetical protein
VHGAQSDLGLRPCHADAREVAAGCETSTGRSD